MARSMHNLLPMASPRFYRLSFLMVYMFVSCANRSDVNGTANEMVDASAVGVDNCQDESPELVCTQSCGSDFFMESTCQGGVMKCPPNTVDFDSCPADTCWGPAPPGCCVNGELWYMACIQGNWECGGESFPSGLVCRNDCEPQIKPSCVVTCGDTEFVDAECHEVIWKCPEGSINSEEC